MVEYAIAHGNAHYSGDECTLLSSKASILSVIAIGVLSLVLKDAWPVCESVCGKQNVFFF